jgi:Fe-S-cluster containining protein
MRFPRRVVERVREIVKSYPGFEDDVRRVLRSKYMRTVDLVDVAWLLKYQNKVCSKCGECCRTVSKIRITMRDLRRIAGYMNVSVEELFKTLKLTVRKDKVYDMQGPCPFLKRNLCSIHPVRPTVCREYPAGFLLRQMVESPDGKVIVPISCGIIREMLARKLASAVLWRRLARERPEVAGKIEEFLTCPEDLAEQPLREQLKWIMKKMDEVRRYVETLKT